MAVDHDLEFPLPALVIFQRRFMKCFPIRGHDPKASLVAAALSSRATRSVWERRLAWLLREENLLATRPQHSAWPQSFDLKPKVPRCVRVLAP